MGKVKMQILRKTKSVCQVCLKEVEAQLQEKQGEVFLVKNCLEHANVDVRLSSHADYYIPLDKFYFSVMTHELPQRDYLVRLTEKCNLKCPICLASSDEFARPDYTLEEFKAFLATKKRKLKIDLISAEPTLREDLPEFFKAAKAGGHIVALHTNGIKLANFNYLKSLKDAGMDEVHLQFDGFSDETNIKLRGQPLAKIKMQALENLQKLDIATDIVMVVAPGVNEAEIAPMLEFCASRLFIKELFFLGLRSLGRARDTQHSGCLMPDEVIDLVEAASKGMVKRFNIMRFQKLYFALLSLLKVRKCFYVQHYILLRKANKYAFLEELFDWDKVDKHLDKLPGLSGSFSRAWWLLGLVAKVLTFKSFTFVLAFIKLKVRLWLGFDISKISGSTLLLGFITACDPFIMDYDIARYCGKGEISTDVKYEDSGAWANIKRERLWLKEKGEAV
jgi:sulfatase maturation enzyme AslB (radical SAM superfamily)